MGSDDVVHLGHRSVLKSGNSLQMTIPHHVAQFMQIEAGDALSVRFDRENDELRVVAAEREAEQIPGEA